VIELEPDAYASCPLLTEVPIFTGTARAVVERLAAGRIWLDGRTAHALHNYGMGLVWGEDVGRAFPELIAHLKGGEYREKDEWLQIDPRWAYLDWDGQLAAPRFTRVNFRFDRDVFTARHSEPALPPGWSIAPLRESEFDLPDIAVSPRPFWKSFASFSAHGGGVCAVKDGEVGAIAFSATRFDDWLEIGIETRARYRGQGLARAVAAAMIRNCLTSGLTPVWACRKENTASLMLAQSLGFVVTKEVPFWQLAAR
jgi:RimJ/RimL family protein N-acetyltransferase